MTDGATVRIFRLRMAFDAFGNARFQNVWPVDSDTVDWTGQWSFNCQSRAALWPQCGALVEVLNPGRPAGNFPFVEGGAVGMDLMTRRRIEATLPPAEFLDLRGTDGRAYQLMNILECTECLDEDACEWRSLPTRARVSVTRFAFVPSRLPKFSLFKVKAAPWHIFASSGHVPNESEFMSAYEAMGLRGLDFQEVWNDERAPIPSIPY